MKYIRYKSVVILDFKIKTYRVPKNDSDRRGIKTKEKGKVFKVISMLREYFAFFFRFPQRYCYCV